MKSLQAKLSRRGFLLAAGAGSAVATAALVTRNSREALPGNREKVAESKGYRFTDHVKNYYRSAKV